jgi:aminoglycoside phosphotransferase (APT) family kinase protein
VLRALSGTAAGPLCPPVEASSDAPAMIVTRRVAGDAVGFEQADLLADGVLARQLAGALAAIHDPSTRSAVEHHVPELPGPVPQADTEAIRSRLGRFVEPADLAVVLGWCDWVDDVQRAQASDPVLLHGDLHGYNMLAVGTTLTCLLDYDAVCDGDHHYDFRYLPALVGSIRPFCDVAEAYEQLTGRRVEPAPVLAWHLRTMLGDALWRSEARVPLPDGGTVEEWIAAGRVRIEQLAAWRGFDRPRA